MKNVLLTKIDTGYVITLVGSDRQFNFEVDNTWDLWAQLSFRKDDGSAEVTINDQVHVIPEVLSNELFDVLTPHASFELDGIFEATQDTYRTHAVQH